MYGYPFIRVYWIWHGFEEEPDSLQTKNWRISRYQTIWRICILRNKKKRDKSKFVTKSVGIIVTIIFPAKISLKSLVKLFHLKRKIVNKTTCKTPSANPHQLCVH